MTLGLTEKEVVKSRTKYGSNEITKQKGSTFFSLLLESLADPIIKILLIALSIKIVFLFKSFDWYETLGILIAIFLASFISSISEYGSNKAFERLKKESELLKSKVYRDGILKEIYNKEIVVGDVIKLASGDKVPADGIIIEGYLSLDESFLTGESKEVNKQKGKEIYSSSVIYKGDALFKVTKVGDKTYIGSISLKLQDKTEDSPLRKRLRILASSISKLGYIGAFLASLSYLFLSLVYENNFSLDLIMSDLTSLPIMMNHLIYALTLCVTIVIMAVPEGLPMMITLVLSSNMKKMLKDKVLVRKLVGIETSGSLNVLLCDKTGTLTEGKHKMSALISKENKVFRSLNDLSKYQIYTDKFLKSSLINNEATLSEKNIIGGNSTDRAILDFVKSGKVNAKVIKNKEFDSKDKYSYVTLNDNYTYYKGASEVLLPKCNRYLSLEGKVMTLLNKIYLNSIINKYTSEGYRVLICAYNEKEGLENLIFIGIIVICDEVRKEAKDSIKMITKAGIKVIMITGDSQNTALSIGKKLGLANSQSLVLTHNDLVKMSDEKLREIAPYLKIVARALPEDKSRLVNIYKSLGKVVGMTGDGVNDALALKKSDVAFALGSGSEVAKEASDIVILDNNINSICKAILYGRTIFKSIRKFVTYQLTVNCCALFLSIVGTLIGIATPITIIQMLWLNMIMDTFAGLAFSYEAPLKEYMEESPKDPSEKIMNKYMFNQIIVNGFFSSLLCILLLKWPLLSNLFRPGKYLMTAFFALFIFLGIINSFLSRTHRLNLLANINKNKVFILINLFIFTVQIFIIYYGGSLFRAFGLTLKELLVVFLLSLLVIPVDLIRKLYLKKKGVTLGM